MCDPYLCDRCKVGNAVRIIIKSIDNIEIKTKEIDLCSKCVFYGFGYLVKRLPEEEVDKWLSQFKSGIM